MTKIKSGIFSSQAGIFVIYILTSALAIMGFRLVFPGEAVPLEHFSLSWRLTRGLLDFLALFPALALSALIIPFGFKTRAREKINPFSPAFLQSLKMPIIFAIIAAALYGIVLFLVFPAAQNYEADMRFRSRLYLTAKDSAQEHAEAGEWEEAADFLAVCERIWPGSKELEKLNIEVKINTGEKQAAPAVPEEEPKNESVDGEEEKMTATKALALAETALAEERYFDAHWLATLGGELAKDESAEKVIAAALAGRAWNGVNSLEPNNRESETYDTFKKKRDGHIAFLGKEWIRAYYIFRELKDKTPDDPDVREFFAMSEKEVRRIAFFTDEIDLTLGKTLSGAVFSLPLDSGRLVMRISSLSTFPDTAYGTEAELLAFDRNGQPLWNVKTRYVKILPLNIESGRESLPADSAGREPADIQSGTSAPEENAGPALSVLLRAIDKDDATRRFEPEIVGAAAPDTAALVLAIPWDDFLLLSDVRRGLFGLSPAELIHASEKLKNYGYLPQIFEAEIVRRFAEPLFLLPLGIFAIVAGWRYRALKRPRYMGIPMLVILPLVLNGVVRFFWSWVSELGTWAVISFGFGAAAVSLGIGILILFISSLITLAAQHG